MLRLLSNMASIHLGASLLKLSSPKSASALSVLRCFARAHAARGFRSREPSPLLSYVANVPAKEQPSWRRLAEQIKDSGSLAGSDDATESVYAARLRANYDRRDHIEKIEQEVMEEMASSLGRTGDKVNYHFLLLERQGCACDVAAEAAEQAHAALAACTLAELQDQCRAAGLPASDRQAALVSHLLDPGGSAAAAASGGPAEDHVLSSRAESDAAGPQVKARETPHQALVAAVHEFNRRWSAAAAARRELTIHRQCVGFNAGNHTAIENAWPLPPRRAVAALARAGEVAGSGLEAEEARNRAWLKKMEYLARK